MDPARAGRRERLDRARVQQRVLADQGAVEVAGEGLDVAGEVFGEDQPEVAWTT
ncbi:MAG TPA: hypothetical protein VMT59_06620 [Gaiellaceae bacterium]|nr:hypothetical protein [Gaiellaceae bacterium]